MIIPNLMVADIQRSLAFYRDKLDMTVMMTVGADKTFNQGSEVVTDPVFAIVEWGGDQLMLQTRGSLTADLPTVPAGGDAGLWGTVYMRGFAPDVVMEKIDAADVVKGPETSWYGMRELYVRDPDGHVICLGAPDGEAPDGATPES